MVCDAETETLGEVLSEGDDVADGEAEKEGDREVVPLGDCDVEGDSLAVGD